MHPLGKGAITRLGKHWQGRRGKQRAQATAAKATDCGTPAYCCRGGAASAKKRKAAHLANRVKTRQKGAPAPPPQPGGPALPQPRGRRSPAPSAGAAPSAAPLKAPPLPPPPQLQPPRWAPPRWRVAPPPRPVTGARLEPLGRPLNGRWSCLEQRPGACGWRRGEEGRCRARPGGPGEPLRGDGGLRASAGGGGRIGVRPLEEVRALEPWAKRKAGGDFGNAAGEGSDPSFGAQKRERPSGQSRGRGRGTAWGRVSAVGLHPQVTVALQAFLGRAPAPLSDCGKGGRPPGQGIPFRRPGRRLVRVFWEVPLCYVFHGDVWSQ